VIWILASLFWEHSVYCLQNVVFQLHLAKTVLRSSRNLMAIAKLLVNCRAKSSRLVVCRDQLWCQNFDRKLVNISFCASAVTNLDKHRHTCMLIGCRNNACEVVKFVGRCIMDLVVKAQNNWCDVERPSSCNASQFVTFLVLYCFFSNASRLSYKQLPEMCWWNVSASQCHLWWS